MRTFVTKPKNEFVQAPKSKSSRPVTSPVESVLHLQRVLGNQETRQLFQSGAIQAKLSVGQPGDVYEQEADRVAEQVMRMPDSVAQMQQPGEEEKLQTKTDSGEAPTVDPVLEGNINNLRGGGQPLPGPLRDYFEPRFGYDFGQVRVHTDSGAAGLARAVNARAFTLGQDVVFGAGQYAPEHEEGKKLVAHELTHVIQQNQFGNQAVQRIVHYGVLQRSALSEDLQWVWRNEGKEAFFERLSSLQETDSDVNGFVEQTLTGADLRRARRILGTDVPLSDVQRGALLTLLVSNLGTAETRYSVACQQVVQDIQAEQAAQVELLVGLVTVGITYVVPGLGAAISRLVNNIPASSSVTIHAVALGIQSRAGAIASAIGEAGKRAAAPAVRAALANSPRGFTNALIEGFGAAKNQIVSSITVNIQNRSALSDEDLWVYVSNWDPAERTIAGYTGNIRDLYNRWRDQVQAISPLRDGRRSTIEQDRPYSTQVGVIWVQHSSGDVLVQATVSDGRLTFNRFIDADLRDMALSRAATTQPRGVQTIPAGTPYIFGVPAVVPRNVARR